MGIFRKNVICNVFVVLGILNIVVGVCIFVVVIWNYYLVMNEEEIVFLLYFYVFFKSDV